jgi:hypothetical protein
VLRKEEEHRQLHKRRECHCEVIFDAEERERRLRPRGKGKGKAKELARIEFGGQGGGEGVARVGVAGVAGVATNGHGGDATGAGVGSRSDMAEAGSSLFQQDWASGAPMAAYQYVGYQISGNVNGAVQQEQGAGFPVGGNSQMALVHRPGYPASGGVGRMDLEQVATGHGFPDGGFVPREYLWVGQLEIGQPGAGMKWYPQEEANMPPVPDLHASPTKGFDKMPRVWQRAKSEPAEKISHPASPAVTFTTPVAVAVAEAEPQQPAIVSSDMVAL